MTREEALEIERKLQEAGSISALAGVLGVSRTTAHQRRRLAEAVLGRSLVSPVRGATKAALAKAIAEAVVEGRIGPWFGDVAKEYDSHERWVRDIASRAGIKRRCVYLPEEVSDAALRNAIRDLIRYTGVTEAKLVRRMEGT